MIRRTIFVQIIYFMHEFAGLQLVSHIILTLIYTIFIIKVQPYTERKTNRMEVFNEICIINTSYFLMWLSTHGVDDVETRTTIGWFYIVVSSIGIVVNFCLLTYNIARGVPSQLRSTIEKITYVRYMFWKH